MANPIQSKKLAAFLVAELTWKILAVLVLFWGRDSIANQVWAILMAIVVVAGFVEAVYIGGQASLDKYLKVVELATKTGASVDLKGLKIQGQNNNGQVTGSDGKDSR